MTGLVLESTNKSIGCSEHESIVEHYIDWQSMRRVAEKFNRSTESVHKQIKLHNLAIKVTRPHCCPRCVVANYGEAEWPAKTMVLVTKKRDMQKNTHLQG